MNKNFKVLEGEKMGQLGIHEQGVHEITKKQYEKCWNKQPSDKKVPGYFEDEDLIKEFGECRVIGYGLTTGKAYEENGRYFVKTDESTYCD